MVNEFADLADKFGTVSETDTLSLSTDSTCLHGYIIPRSGRCVAGGEQLKDRPANNGPAFWIMTGAEEMRIFFLYLGRLY